MPQNPENNGTSKASLIHNGYFFWTKPQNIFNVPSTFLYKTKTFTANSFPDNN